MPEHVERNDEEKPKANDSIGHWETLDDALVADCTIFKVRRRLQRSPVSGAEGTFHIISSTNWVNVLPITTDNRVVMIRQYRHGIDEITLELPGGFIDAGESPLEAGVRELFEETGYRAAEAEVIGSVRPNPALFDNTAYTVLATGVTLESEQNLDDMEEIAVELYTFDEIDRMLKDGTISHTLIINAFFRYRLMQDERNGS